MDTDGVARLAAKMQSDIAAVVDRGTSERALGADRGEDMVRDRARDRSHRRDEGRSEGRDRPRHRPCDGARQRRRAGAGGRAQGRQFL